MKKCRICKAIFQPRHSFESWCSPEHGLIIAKAKLAKINKAKDLVEKREHKAKLDKLKTRAQWLKECQAVINKVARLRDIRAGKGCISCGLKYKGKFGGAFDAGHLRSVGSAPHIRFWLPQIKLQCVSCNRHQGGRALDFRQALVAQRGLAWVENLESMQGQGKWSIDYLSRLKRVMTKKVKRLESRMMKET